MAGMLQMQDLRRSPVDQIVAMSLDGNDSIQQGLVFLLIERAVGRVTRR